MLSGRQVQTVAVSSGVAEGEKRYFWRAVLTGRDLGDQERTQVQKHSHTNNTDR